MADPRAPKAHDAARVIAEELVKRLLDRSCRTAGVSAAHLHALDPLLRGDLVELALEHQRRWLNAQDGDRSTPLAPEGYERELPAEQGRLPRGVGGR